MKWAALNVIITFTCFFLTVSIKHRLCFQVTKINPMRSLVLRFSPCCKHSVFSISISWSCALRLFWTWLDVVKEILTKKRFLQSSTLASFHGLQGTRLWILHSFCCRSDLRFSADDDDKKAYGQPKKAHTCTISLSCIIGCNSVTKFSNHIWPALQHILYTWLKRRTELLTDNHLMVAGQEDASVCIY